MSIVLMKGTPVNPDKEPEASNFSARKKRTKKLRGRFTRPPFAFFESDF